MKRGRKNPDKTEARSRSTARDRQPAKPRRGIVARAFERLPWKIRAATLLTIFAALLVTIALSVAFIYYTIRFPDLIALRQRDAAPVVRVLAADGTLLAERGAAYDFMPYDLLPGHVMNAVVATEDRRFFQHHGVDQIGLLRAAFANLRAGRVAQGGSTLTQQLAKNLFLTSERSFRRKIEEFVIALWLEARLSKEDILELYLNRVYFGSGAYGIEAAAQRYFGKSARYLTVSEAAVIAGLLKAPSKFAPSSSPELATARAQVVLKSMVAAGLLSEAEEQKALHAPLRFAAPVAGPAGTGYEYAVEFVLERLPPLVGNGSKEVVVHTTIDAALQRRAQAIVATVLAAEGRIAGASQAAVVVLDTEGRIRALVGGRSWAESQFDRAATARRQPGSAFKPIVYLSALEAGRTPDTLVVDAPVTIGSWSPRNDSGRYDGPMTLRQALAQSVNTVAVRLQQDVGAARIIAMARRLGIRSELREGPSLALGTSELTLLELTSAYDVLASGGVAVTPHALEKVRSSTGAVLYSRAPSRASVLVAADQLHAINNMLSAAIASGTGRRAALPRNPAAGKTGTTQDFRDAWFVGYTANLAAGVWVGNDDARPMHRVTGGSLPARIWRDVMTVAHERVPPAPLPGADLPRTASAR